MSDHREFSSDGYAARQAGKRLIDNPHITDSDAAAWWTLGWCDAERHARTVEQEAVIYD